MSDLEEFERHQASLLNMRYEDLKTQFDHHLKVFGNRYAAFSDFEKEWELWQAAWKARQSEIDQLKTELALCREENKGLVGRVSELKKHAEMLIGAAKSWTYSEGEKNILLSQADDIDRILNGEKALRGGDQNTKNKAQSIENIGYEGGDQKAQQSETAPVPKWSTINVVCHRCGHYLNGCHCNHFGDQCPHLNTSKFGDDGLAECFNCNKIINKDREVVEGANDINLPR